MTTSRIVRGTKARIFVYICVVLVVTGIIACLNNTFSRLEDAQKSNEICHQQEENLSMQLQVISDYKQRLEKSLKTEKAEHQQAVTELENRLNEEKSKNDKNTNEANLKFSSLQQHYNLLKTQNEDLKEECSKTENVQANEINDLQAKLKEVQEELKKVSSSKEALKSQYLQVKTNEENVRKELNEYVNKNNDDLKYEINHLTKINNELQREMEELKAKCSTYDSLQAPIAPFEQPLQTSSKQIQVGDKAGDPQSQVIDPPSNENYMKTPSKSTTLSSVKASQGSLNLAIPLALPTMTPKSAKQSTPSTAKKLPEGVVPVPKKRDVEKMGDSEKNELPDQAVNGRYRNKISDIQVKDETDKENGAHEIYDQPLHNGAYDALGFGDLNEPPNKNGKSNKHHIDNLVIGQERIRNYEDNQNAIQAEENEDDDLDDYGDLTPLKDQIVRH